MGTYTELWAGLSPGLRGETNGNVIPQGRIHSSPRQDLPAVSKSGEEQRGAGEARRVVEIVRDTDDGALFVTIQSECCSVSN